MSENQNVLLKIDDLQTTFNTVRGSITAINGVSFKVRKGEVLGLVGESGCGKSVTAQSIMRLYDEKKLVSYKGSIQFDGKNILKLTPEEMEKLRGSEIAMVFQDSLSSLDPLFTVGDQIAETLISHKKIDRKQAWKRALKLLELTGIPAPEQRIKAYPHELSGGMRQRVMIAMALSCDPKLLIADEPTTALDVTIQAQIMDLIVDLNHSLGMSVILITHDLGVVATVCQRVIIMYLGEVVEEGLVSDIFNNPLHPYTKGLIKSIPTFATPKNEPLYMIRGSVPVLNEVKTGCRFCNRCEQARDQCKIETPVPVQVNGTQTVRCWNYKNKQILHKRG